MSSILPPMPYTPTPFRRGALSDTLTVFYRWDEKATGDLRSSLSSNPDEYSGWINLVENPLSRLVDRIEVRRADSDPQVYRLPADRDARISWLQETFPPRLLGEICGAIITGTFDSVDLVGKS